MSAPVGRDRGAGELAVDLAADAIEDLLHLTLTLWALPQHDRPHDVINVAILQADRDR